MVWAVYNAVKMKKYPLIPLFLVFLILSLALVPAINIATAQNTSNNDDAGVAARKAVVQAAEKITRGFAVFGKSPRIEPSAVEEIYTSTTAAMGRDIGRVTVPSIDRARDTGISRITPAGIIPQDKYGIVERKRITPIKPITPTEYRQRRVAPVGYITPPEYKARMPTISRVAPVEYLTLSEYKARMPKTTRVAPSGVSGRPTGAGIGKEYMTVHEYRALHPSEKRISPAGTRVSGITPTVETMDIGLPAVDIKASINKAMAEARAFAEDNHWIVYLAILIISALISRSGGWQMGIISAMALSIMFAVTGLIEGYSVFVILLACAGLFTLSIGKATG